MSSAVAETFSSFPVAGLGSDTVCLFVQQSDEQLEIFANMQSTLQGLPVIPYTPVDLISLTVTS